MRFKYSLCNRKKMIELSKAVYAGSFDPFTLGHLDIVEQAIPLFDEVIILLCNNSSKTRMTNVATMATMIGKCCLKYNNVKVQVCSMLVADYCKEQECEYLIRGLRNTTDYLYEESVAKINTEINPDLKTIYFRTRNEVLSSTFVKELYRYGKDITKYLPEEIHL